MGKRRRRIIIARKFNKKRFTLWATADSKSTAKVVAQAKKDQNFDVRTTKTKSKKEPYRIWIRKKGR